MKDLNKIFIKKQRVLKVKKIICIILAFASLITFIILMWFYDVDLLKILWLIIPAYGFTVFALWLGDKIWQNENKAYLGKQ